MVGMGVQLEEGVREGRLVNESVPAGNSKKKGQEVNMVKGQPRPQAHRTQFDPIPMKYADLLPSLLKKHLVQTRPPPKVPERLPAWYRPDKFCAFHQGAPGHDTEYCYALKAAVQKLIRDKDLSFET
ncbi:hypothetical protein MTR_4g045717 [Medicago truncatula]|uniref:Uncharacterized protein n=1 Tax=Medicago truncatula TaxID=3880 RepID=A0A072UUM2_MEDTR|nr:hypothetical protein MTR_4g045717 [Medicago truncatula]